MVRGPRSIPEQALQTVKAARNIYGGQVLQLRLDDELASAITRHRDELERRMGAPGVEITLAAAVRALIKQGLEAEQKRALRKAKR